MKYITNAYWDKGGRENNEDSLALEVVATPKGDVVMAAVADGVGGLSEGETASGFLLEIITARFLGEIVPSIVRGFSPGKIKRILERGIYFASGELAKYGKFKSHDLGTTLAVLILYKNWYLAVNIGDSPIYKVKKKGLKKISFSHVNSDGSLGRCVGSHGYQPCFFRLGPVYKNTAFLVCTDGFGRRIPMDCDTFNGKNIQTEEAIGSRLRQMAAYLKGRGEGDNMTAAFIKCC